MHEQYLIKFAMRFCLSFLLAIVPNDICLSRDGCDVDFHNLDGVWTQVGYVCSNERFGEESLVKSNRNSMFIIIKGNRAYLIGSNLVVSPCRIDIKDSLNGRAMNLIDTDNNTERRVLFKIEDDILSICQTTGNKTLIRPEKFDASDGLFAIYSFKRITEPIKLTIGSKTQRKFAGLWEMECLEIDGKKTEIEDQLYYLFNRELIYFEGSKFVSVGVNMRSSLVIKMGKFELINKEGVNALDFYTEHKYKLAIYSFVKDKLDLCWSINDNMFRPNRFSTQLNSNTVRSVMRRVDID